MTKTVIRTTTAAALIGALGTIGGAGVATAGTELTFGLGVRVQSDSNPGLTPAGSAHSVTGGIDLSFGLTEETAQSTLSLQGSAGLLTADGDGAIASGLTNPGLTLSYARTSANAGFTLDAAVSQADVGADVIDNFQTGTGLRRVASLSTALTLGTGGPLGFGLNAGVTDISYHDSPNAALTDSSTRRLGADLRTDLSQVLHATFGLSTSRFQQDGLTARDTNGLSTGLTLDRPTGPLSLRLTFDDTPDGQRSGLNFTQSIDLPGGGTISYTLGATNGVTGKTYPSGAFTYARDLPNGGISLDLSRAVQPGAETDAETVQSRASLGYTRAVTPRANLALNLNWAEQRATATDLATANTSLSATWTQSLTEAWALDLGLTHRIRDQDGVGRGQSDTILIEFRRAFSIRP